MRFCGPSTNPLPLIGLFLVFPFFTPIRTGWCFLPGSRFCASNFGSNKGTQSKLSYFPKNLMQIR